jgi:hypothetical protein
MIAGVPLRPVRSPGAHAIDLPDRLVASAADVRTKLDEARAAMNTDDMDAAEKAATGAWLQWLKSAAEELLVPQEPPEGFDAGAWSELRERVYGHASAVLGADEPATALAEYTAGYAEYIAGLAVDLERRAVNSSNGAETRPSLSWDGTTRYFGSTRPGGDGGADHYVTTRSLD